MDDEKKFWIWLSTVFGRCNVRMKEIMCLFGSAREAYTAFRSGNPPFSLSEKEKKNIENVDISFTDSVLEKCRRQKIEIISYGSENYPYRLKSLFSPPAVLYCLGNVDCLKSREIVTAVGTRRASAYSLRVSERICSELAGEGVTIASGFAVGLDICSQMAGVKRGCPTIAVTACGVDVNYPRENYKYRELVLQSGGLIISDSVPGEPARSENFQRRNAIMSGISDAVIIFQAPVNSGSLVTANIAVNQGKLLFCLPPADLYSGEYAGNVSLLSDGAIPLYSSADVIAELRNNKILTFAECNIRRGVGEKRSKEDRPAKADMSVYEIIRSMIGGKDEDSKPVKRKKTEKSEKSEKSVKSKKSENSNNADSSDSIKLWESISNTVTDDNSSADSLNETQQRIVDLLRGGKLHIDEIAVRLSLGQQELISELMELEILGRVKSMPGKIYSL